MVTISDSVAVESSDTVTLTVTALDSVVDGAASNSSTLTSASFIWSMSHRDGIGQAMGF